MLVRRMTGPGFGERGGMHFKAISRQPWAGRNIYGCPLPSFGIQQRIDIINMCSAGRCTAFHIHAVFAAELEHVISERPVTFIFPPTAWCLAVSAAPARIDHTGCFVNGTFQAPSVTMISSSISFGHVPVLAQHLLLRGNMHFEIFQFSGGSFGHFTGFTQFAFCNRAFAWNETHHNQRVSVGNGTVENNRVTMVKIYFIQAI